MTAGSELTLKIQYTKNDLWRATYYDATRKPILWVLAIVPIFSIPTVLAGNPIRWFAALAASLLLLVLIPYSSVRAALKSNAVLAPITFTFSEGGVSAEYINGKNNADWTLVTGASENSSFILVKMQRGSFHPIPKRQISST